MHKWKHLAQTVFKTCRLNFEMTHTEVLTQFETHTHTNNNNKNTYEKQPVAFCLPKGRDGKVNPSGLFTEYAKKQHLDPKCNYHEIPVLKSNKNSVFTTEKKYRTHGVWSW